MNAYRWFIVGAAAVVMLQFVLDVTMPEIDGLEAWRPLTLGASAFVLKYRAWEQLLPAVQRAYIGSDAPAERA